MASGIHRLSDRQIKAHKQRGRLSDGGGLYLQVSAWGTKSWEFRFTLHGKTRTMGLGQYELVPLKKAREEAEALRQLVREGNDPIEARNAAKLKAQIEAATSILFKDAVEKCIARKEGEFRSDRHRKNWRRSMDAYAVPVIGDMNVAHVTTQDILRVLNQPVDDGTLWENRTETASRLRGRIENVLSWATVAGFRSGDNPARWMGNLKELLPTPSKVAKVTKQPALSQADLPKWFADMRKRDGMAARALEFLTLPFLKSYVWDEGTPRHGGWFVERYSPRAFERWVHGFNGKNGMWMYDPADKAFWLGRLAGHQTYVEETTWYSDGGEENYGGGFYKYSKRFKELTLEGPFKAEDLLIKVSSRRAFSRSGYNWPAARIANLVPA